MNNPIEMHRSADGQAQVEVRLGQETVWRLSQAQMAQLFGSSADNTFEEHFCRARIG